MFKSIKYLSVKMCLKLFDATIKPIMLYCAEIWGPYAIKLDKILNAEYTDCYEKFKLEQVCNRFYKTILGVHSKASNIGTKGELGKFPLVNDIVIFSLKYWLQIVMDKPKESLVYSCYLEQLNNFISGENDHLWVLFIHKSLTYYNSEETWINQGTFNHETKSGNLLCFEMA